MRTSLSLILTALICLQAPAAYAACNQSNPNDPENDCDLDGCPIGVGGVWDCNDSPDGGAKQHKDACPSPVSSNAEVCDGIDNNCNGGTDEGNPGGGGMCPVPGAQGVCIPGTFQCVNGQPKCVSITGSSTEICDGKDNDCDGLTDENDLVPAEKITKSCYSGPSGTATVGLCRSGQQACKVTVVGTPAYTNCGACEGLATCLTEVVPTNTPTGPEVGAPLCDGKDNDCDGTADDGNPGGGGVCSTGLPGVCGPGTNQCQGDAGVLCTQNVPSSGEVCDGKDNDCDNDIDEQGVAGSQKLTDPCYTGTAITRGVGECRDGQRACNATVGSGMASYTACGVCGVLATCTTEKLPEAEACSTKDEDCDGNLNNGNPGGGTACPTNLSGRCWTGIQNCNNSGGYTCTPTVTPGSVTETCNGIDDDCDGFTDERNAAGAKLQQSCYPGDAGINGTANVGICRNGSRNCNSAQDSGVTSYDNPTCSNAITAETPPGLPELLCDSRDEDCDGTQDEPFSIGQTCASGGVGYCSVGTYACKADKSGNQCNARMGIPEVCDNIDQDCDGVVNNGNPGGGVACPTGLPGRCSSGLSRCSTVNDAGTPACDQTSFPITETCNGIDDDCNGTRDDIPGLGTACNTAAMGLCMPGTLRCVGNNPTCVSNVTPQPEICDGLDNNCDGLPDNNVPQQKCWTGSASTHTGTCPGPGCFGKGLCQPGLQACTTLPDGGPGFGACMGEVPPAPEICDTFDNDCDGNNDNGLIHDDDNDMTRACGTCGALAAPNCDCNDSPDGGANIRPGRLELCNGLDDNCNGTTDEGSLPGTKISRGCYSGPANSQGKGTCVAGTQECNATPGGTESYGMCIGQVVPTNPPDAGEVNCNAKDDDCDGVVDDGFDNDNDLYVSCAMCPGYDAGPCDCNDSDFVIKPGAVEICDAVDQDCDGLLNDVPQRRCFSDGAGMIPDVKTYTGTCPGPTCSPNLECRAGTQECSVAGAWGVCANGALGNLVLPATEVCDDKDNDCDGLVDNANFDMDGDGYKSCATCMIANCDCDDADPSTHPGAPEICDNKDNDCNGLKDGLNTACYSGPANTRGLGACRDGTQVCTDGVGSGACNGEVVPLLLPDGGVPFYADGGLGPNDPEANCNGIDDDCDGIVDDGFDLDGDGQTTCQGDCDDRDPFQTDGGAELCDCKDNNCNAVIDDNDVCRGAPCHDFDHDGFTNCQGDCDDVSATGAAIGPNRTEVVGDGVDNDCDGAVDEDTDEDGDGYSTGQGDCNDHVREVFPGAVERCDGFDNNCNNLIDEGFDVDLDGVSSCAGDCNDGDSTISTVRAEVCGNGKDDNCNGRVDEDLDVDNDGVSTCQGDCNDFNDRVHPAAGSVLAADEVCDGQDNNCDRSTDEGFDVDHDGVSSCFGDCDDNDANVNQLSVEIPGNLIDDNCDGQIDEGTIDRDNDGFTPICGDCNDSDPTVNPHAREVCDRVDNNCDGFVDSSRGVYNLCSVCFDADGDGQTNCDGDCNDADRAIYRGAPELCDEKDNDCDGMIDLDPASGLKVCREDAGVTVDAGRADSGVDAGPSSTVDAGPVGGTDAGSTTKPRDVVAINCGCSSSDGVAPLALIGLMFLAMRRRRTGQVPGRVEPVETSPRAIQFASLVVVLLLVACTPSSVVAPVDDGGTSSSGDGGGVGGGSDGGKKDAGIIIIDPNWKCPGLTPVPHLGVGVPSTEVTFAYGENYTRAPNSVTVVDAGNAVLFDDVENEIAAAILVRDLPARVSPTDPAVLDELAGREIAALNNLQGSPLVRVRTERFSKVFDDERHSKNFSTSQDLSFATPTNAYSVRNRLLAGFSNRSPASLGTLPVGEGATAETDISVSVFFRITSTATESRVSIGFAVTPLSKFKANQSRMSDLTNGSHLSAIGATIEYDCEPRTTPALKTDFIFVMDNTPSTVIWHGALENASASLFQAFQNSGLDFRVGVVTTDSDILRGDGFTNDLDKFKAALQVGLAGNTTEMGIEYGLRAVQRAKAATAPELKIRDEAGLVVLFMSDEDNHGTRPVAEYVTEYKAANAVAFSIVGPRPMGCINVGYAQAQVGGQYITLANQTGGSSGSICNSNVTEVIEEIVVGALGASSRSALLKRPISGSISIQSNKLQIPRSRSDGFDYEPGNANILFFGKSAPKVNASYDAAYAYFQYID